VRDPKKAGKSTLSSPNSQGPQFKDGERGEGGKKKKNRMVVQVTGQKRTRDTSRVRSPMTRRGMLVMPKEGKVKETVGNPGEKLA